VIGQVFKALWQRCRVHFMRNAFAHVPKDQQSMVAGAIRTVFAQETPQAASTAWSHVADQLRPRLPKLAALMDDAEQGGAEHSAEHLGGSTGMIWAVHSNDVRPGMF